MKMKRALLAAAFLLISTVAQSFGLTLQPYSGQVELKLQGISYVDLTTDPDSTTAYYTLTSIGYTTGISPFLTTHNIWSQGSGEYAYGIMTGLYDVTDPVDNKFEQAGGSFAFYQFSNPLAFTSMSQAISLIQTGTLLFSGNLATGILGTTPLTTVEQIYNPSTGQGQGEGYGNLTANAGTMYNTFNSDSQKNGTDFYFLFDTESLGGNYYKINDPITGAVVPEPSTMMLVGAGLFGLAVYARRKRV